MSSINGTNGDDVLSGSSGADEIRGLGGNDVIDGGSGRDTIFGGAGDDELNGGSGADVIRGGSGDDTIDGGSGADEIYGGADDDTISGGSGADLLYGGTGDDDIDGGNGADRLEGGAGDDSLDGGRGSDVLIGGEGDDELTGGSGADTFVFSGDFGDDVITDLQNNDTIDISAFSAITSTDSPLLGIEQQGSNVLITITGGSGGTITVENATLEEVRDRLQVACLMRGTLVATPKGLTAVERLAIGDEVTTLDGASRRIKWIGMRGYARSFVEGNARAAPVRIAAGTLGQNTPFRDLYVSPEHCILVRGTLVPAQLLIDGSAIQQEFDLDEVEYFHLEFDQPEVILTNGLPTESYVDHGNRRLFANYHQFVELYGEPDRDPSERLRRFDAVQSGPVLDLIRSGVRPSRQDAA